MSHPQALAQCETFLAGIPWAVAHAEFDTAGAAYKVKELGDPSLAAIASESAARLFGLEILKKGIEMQSGNATRFVEVALHNMPSPATGACKTSLVMTLDHSAGALGQVLTEFGRRGLQLAKIESRPVQTDAWRYRFYLDVEIARRLRADVGGARGDPPAHRRAAPAGHLPAGRALAAAARRGAGRPRRRSRLRPPS